MLKTAYEMRISDWSSDVCSSDLLGLRTRLTAVSETHTVAVGDVRRVLTGVALITLSVEAVVAVILTLRWWTGYGEEAGRAIWLGVFHAVSAEIGRASGRARVCPNG